MSSPELARRAGLSKATLSQLEAGRGNPTIETLDALAVALRIPLSDLLARDTDPGPVFVPRTDLADGEVGRELLRRVSSGNGLEIWRLRMPRETHLDGVPHATGTTEHLSPPAGSPRGPSTRSPSCVPAICSPSRAMSRTSIAPARRGLTSRSSSLPRSPAERHTLALSITTRTQHIFTSDNTAGACEEILRAVTDAATGQDLPCGADRYTTGAREVFERDVDVLPVSTGSAATATAASTPTSCGRPRPAKPATLGATGRAA
ncbi:helix-turn-helix domain-containing protein [Streptomyces sp. NPDC001833]|uniref:helix-turn-helix domain-containing protein n=1 Tax=Streptomyces sp. NPDC001833 TaxID=3154658 RepID=UPI0033211AA4